MLTSIGDNADLNQRSVVLRCWWIFAFIVSLIVFSSSTLVFLDREAHAIPLDGGSGGGSSPTLTTTDKPTTSTPTTDTSTPTTSAPTTDTSTPTTSAPTTDTSTPTTSAPTTDTSTTTDLMPTREALPTTEPVLNDPLPATEPVLNDPLPATEPVLTAPLTDPVSAAPLGTEALLSSYLESLGRSVVDGLLNLLAGVVGALSKGLQSLLDFLGGLAGALHQGLQSFPAGAIPAAGGLSVGSSSSSGFGGKDLDPAALALLAILLLSGKYLWSASEFLRPNSAFRLAVERPG